MSERMSRLLASAGFERVSPLSAVLVTLGSSVFMIWVLYLFTRSTPITISFFSCLLVQLQDSFQGRIRKLRFQQNQDWPKYLDAIHSATWAGTSLVQALLDSRNFAPKTAIWAFDALDRDLAEGMDLDSALVNLKTRLQNPIADRFVELSRLANLSGGRGYLSALRSQSVQLRMENATWLEVSAKQSWVVASARLAVFAPWLILLMLSMRQETADAFSKGSGFIVLFIGLVASIAAFRLVKFLGKLPTQRRNLSGL